MDYSQEAMNYLVQYQQQRIRALEDRVKFLMDELNACYQQAAEGKFKAGEAASILGTTSAVITV